MEVAARAIVALLVALAAVALPVAAQAGDDSPLNSNDTISTYEEEDVVSVQMPDYRLRVTVAEKIEDVGRPSASSGLRHSDVQNTYVRIQYNETVTRTIRLYFDEAYFNPRVADDLESIDEKAMADVEPVEGSPYTKMTITLKGETDAVFKMSKEAGVVFSYMNQYREKVNNSTGWSMPDIFAQPNWQYVESEKLEEEDVYAIEKPKDKDVMLHYDASEPREATNWLIVPKCERSDSSPVCSYEKSGDDSHLYVLSRTSDPPTLRYKYGVDVGDQVKTALSEVSMVDDRVSDFLDGLFGGDD